MKRDNVTLLLLTLILAITFLPWLGDTLFNTKGEPREALVAVTMLNSGNYILPESYGADIPYKPPFLAWLIAGCSVITGEVNEVASRLPSAVATIAMVIAGFLFYRRRTGGNSRPLAMALVTVTTVEVFRAATACRTDMVLTACIVTSIYAMADACRRKGKPAVSWAAVMLMTCSVLTKGPVGMILPCLVSGIYMLIRGYKLQRTLGVMTISGLVSLIVPALWYYAAWVQGGERFLNLAIEENFGRFTGSMSYDSHLNPWWYNVVTIVAGMSPYTLLALLSLFSLKTRWVKPQWHGLMSAADKLLAWLRSLKPETLLALTATVVIFIFYCFPASKRSVYLLPVYPFLSWLTVNLGVWLVKERKRSLTVYAGVIASTGLIVGLLVCGLHIADCSAIPGIKDEAADLVSGLYREEPGITGWTFVIICILTSAATVYFIATHSLRRQAWGAMASALSIYWILGATVLPIVLNAKSDIVIAREVMRLDPEVKHTFTFNNVKMLRYYTAAFYLGDRLRLFAPEENSSQSVESFSSPLPQSGFLIVNAIDMPQWQKRYGDTYVTDTLWTGTRRSSDCRAIPMIVKFQSRK